MRSSLMEKMESLLNIWIEDQNQRRMPLSQMVIQKKALILFENLKEDYPLSSAENAEEFDASRGWFDRFKIRGNLHSIALKGESASADTSAAEKFKLELKAIIEEGGYSAQQVLNADETGLFWKRLPGRTYISKSEKSTPGYKSSKDFKFKPFLIYHSENPRAFKNVKKSELSVHWRANKKAWMTASLFRDWMNNCAAPELKAYCSSKNIEFKMLLLVDNAPGHPVFSDDYSENINVSFMPPNTSLIQPMDQGVISNFESYYLRRTFHRLLKATDGDNMPSMKEFWKNYNILMAIENINLSWKEVRESCMNGTWRQLWPECILRDMGDINDVPHTCKELAESARNANFYGMEEQDINDLLLYEPELNFNQSLTTIQRINTLDNQIIPLQVEAEEKKLTAAKISEAMQLISQAMNIFENNDPDEDRSLRVSRKVTEDINCYKEIYLKKKRYNPTIVRQVHNKISKIDTSLS